MTKIHGQIAFARVVYFTLEISLAIKRFAPNGGVMKPIARFKIIIIPKCTGLTPTALTMGSRIGVRMMIAAFVSIKAPTNSRRMLISSNRRILLVVSPRIASAIIVGISAIARTLPKPEDIPITKRTGVHSITARNPR